MLVILAYSQQQLSNMTVFGILLRKGSVISFGYFYKDLDSVIGTELRYDAICNTGD